MPDFTPDPPAADPPAPDASAPWPVRFAPWRRAFETGFWVVVMSVQMLFNSVVTWIDLRRGGVAFTPWQPFTLELSSNLAIGLLIPAIVAFERRFPLRMATLPRHLGAHLAGSVAFCALHVVLMVAMRDVVYAAMGSDYRVGSWGVQFAYEYLKDVRTYGLILFSVIGYRLLVLRLQGEARVLDAADPPAGSPPETAPQPQPAPARPERFLVRKLRREFLIAAADIEWLQAQGNYVGLHVNGHDYLLRSTLADFMNQLDPARFARVHRSYVVNLDRVAEIEPTDGGDARLRMKDASQVPCSRRYRDALGAAG